MQTEIKLKITKTEYEGLVHFLSKYNDQVHHAIETNTITQLSLEAITASDFVQDQRRKSFAWEFRNSQKLYNMTLKRHEAFAVHQLMAYDKEMPPYLNDLFNGINRQLVNLVPYRLLSSNEVVTTEYFIGS